VGVELGDVSAAKLLPLRRVVAEPLTQLRAGGGILEPTIEIGIVAAQAAWPQPFNKIGRARSKCLVVVHTRQRDLALGGPGWTLLADRISMAA
jgi:hypothetical protein